MYYILYGNHDRHSSKKRDKPLEGLLYCPVPKLPLSHSAAAAVVTTVIILSIPAN